MVVSRWSIGAALLALAACQGDAPSPSQIAAPEPTASAAAIAGPEVRILAFGDSLFAGYGLASPSESYPAQLEAALRADGRNVRVTNAGVSGDTTAAGRQRFVFTLDSQARKPDLVLLELGGNDLLRGLPPEQTRANLAAMLDELKKRDIPVVLMSLQAPPNYGGAWQRQFDAIFPDLGREYGATVVPFVTEKVFTNARLIQPDRVHPTKQGVAVLVEETADEVTDALPDPV